MTGLYPRKGICLYIDATTRGTDALDGADWAAAVLVRQREAKNWALPFFHLINTRNISFALKNLCQRKLHLRRRNVDGFLFDHDRVTDTGQHV